MKSEATLQRLDHYCWQLHPDKSVNAWRALIAQGLVRVNGRPASKGTMIGRQDQVTIDQVFLQRTSELGPGRTKHLSPDAANLALVYQDDYIIVINKPSGMPSHPLLLEDPVTAADLFASLEPKFWSAGPVEREGGLLQRLDNDSSGLLLAARTVQAWHEFAPYFRTATIDNLSQEHSAKKSYLALVHGTMERPLRCNLSISHDGRDSRKMTVASINDHVLQVKAWGEPRGKAREALSVFTPVAQAETSHLLPDKRLDQHYITLVRVELGHGQRHQVRVHAAALGFPLVGDTLYAPDDKQEVLQLNSLLGNKHLLHAHELQFWHPFLEQVMFLGAHPSQKFGQICDQIGIKLDVLPKKTHSSLTKS